MMSCVVDSATTNPTVSQARSRIGSFPGQEPRNCPQNVDSPASTNAREPGSCDPYTMALQALILDDNGNFLEAARTLLERDGITVVWPRRAPREFGSPGS
jgi:hypothetical protein